MTGRVVYTPEAEQQLNELDDWIANAASSAVARTFISAIMLHIDGILSFPSAGRRRDDIRTGMRTTTFRKRTLVAYDVDEQSGETVVRVLGVFHGGQDWETALRPGDRSTEQADPMMEH